MLLKQQRLIIKSWKNGIFRYALCFLYFTTRQPRSLRYSRFSAPMAAGWYWKVVGVLQFVMRLRSVLPVCAVRAVRAVRAVCAVLSVTPGVSVSAFVPSKKCRSHFQTITCANSIRNNPWPISDALFKNSSCLTKSPMKTATMLINRTKLKWNSPIVIN